jgi:hypothetical protein
MRKNWKRAISSLLGLAVGLGLAGNSALAHANEGRRAPRPKQRPPIEIAMRSFSPNPTVGGGPASVNDIGSPNYGALVTFLEKADAYTRGEVKFRIDNWTPAAPNTVIAQVGINGDGQDAAYDLGNALDPNWGLFYLSMAPFHLDYEHTLDWLYSRGLPLAQRLLDERGLNVKILPVLSSGAQGAGYFKAPLGKADCEGESACRHTAPIGLAGLCSSGWALRFLPPAQFILTRACEQLVLEGAIETQNLSFVNAVSGFSNLGAIQAEAITGFEQATPLDDLATFFPEPGAEPIAVERQNPGHKGLRFLHFPAWHQPFVLGYVLLNKIAVWDKLTPSQQRALERAGRDALKTTYAVGEAEQCTRLQALLDFNDDQLQLDADGNPQLDRRGRPKPADLHLARYPAADLRRLQRASAAYLETLRGGAVPTPAQLEYRQIYDSILDYERRAQVRWRAPDFPERCGQ